MHGKRVRKRRINARGNDSPQTKTTNKAINYTAVQAQVVRRYALTTINGSSAGITADSDRKSMASKCRLSVLRAYCIRHYRGRAGKGQCSGSSGRGIKA